MPPARIAGAISWLLPCGSAANTRSIPSSIAVEPLDGRVGIGRREVRMHGAERLTRLAVAEQSRRAQLGVGGEQPQQLAADIARGSEDGSPNHEGRPMVAFAYLCKMMHMYAYDRRTRPAPPGDRRPDPRPARSRARTSSPSGLAALGLAVTQATISRDLEQLGAVKVRRDSRLVYALPDQRQPGDGPDLASVVRDWVRSVDVAGNLVVIRTPPGSAHLVGVALDGSELPEVVGTICGDDTIFIAIRDAAQAPKFARALDGLR